MLIRTLVLGVTTAAFPLAASAQGLTEGMRTAGLVEAAVDYWSGDLDVTGTAEETGGGSQSFTASMPVRIWIEDDGVPRMAVEECISALFPVDKGASLARGGLFREDLEYAGSEPDCGMNPGDKELEEKIVITPDGRGLRIDYAYRWSFTDPYTGTGEASGVAVLAPTFKAATPAPAPKLAAADPAPAPAPTVAAPDTLASAPKPTQGVRSVLAGARAARGYATADEPPETPAPKAQ